MCRKIFLFIMEERASSNKLVNSFFEQKKAKFLFLDWLNRRLDANRGQG